MGVIPLLLEGQPCAAATNLWETTLDFTEFAGQPGGFEDDGSGKVVLQTTGNPGPQTRHYDVLRPNGTDASTGRTLYASGQDGVADLSIRTSIWDGSQGRWGSLQAEKVLGDYRSAVSPNAGTSRSGDFGVVVYEFSLASTLQITADTLNLRLVSANGSGQLYEWAFVTSGGVGDAPFTFGQLDAYGAANYSDLSSASYLNSLGQVSGGAATNQLLPHGKSLSQFLTGAPGQTVSGGNVAPGWYALDDFNSLVLDGPESLNVNPGSGSSTLPSNQTIRAGELGMAGGENLTHFTVWMGFYDVGFDTNGDGFTTSRARQSGVISELSFGSSNAFAGVPEPTSAGLVGVSLVMVCCRRKRGKPEIVKIP